MTRKAAAPSVYQLNITLQYIEPPIWRRIEVPSTLPLCRLHDVLQVVMGWTDRHLHQFEKDGKYWGIPEHDESGDLELMDERQVAIGDVLKAEGESLIYVYDFGDDWRHDVLLEQIRSTEDADPKPVCLAGGRRCPPEDVGGPPGYMQFLEVIFEPGHEDFGRFRHWAGDPVHAEEFDVKAVNKILERKGRPKRRPK